MGYPDPVYYSLNAAFKNSTYFFALCMNEPKQLCECNTDTFQVLEGFYCKERMVTFEEEELIAPF